MHEQLRNIPFELKSISDSGEFVGMASVYGNIDHGNDVMEPGAFDESIREHGAKVRLMDNHKARIGVATVRSTAQGLEATGKINTDKQSGAEALSDLKFYKANGMPMGMSIGYQTKDYDPAHKTKDGARHLKKVRLWEVTITEMPMNEQALVTSVKSMQDLVKSLKAIEGKTDFDSELIKIQLRAIIYMLEQALSNTLWKIRRDSQVADKIAASAEAIDRFKAGYMAVLPDILEMDSDSGLSYMSMPAIQEKAGRKLSKQSRSAITETISKLQALLDDSDPAEKSLAPTGASPEGEGDDNPPPAESSDAADILKKINAALS